METSDQKITPLNHTLGASAFAFNWTWHTPPLGGEEVRVRIPGMAVIGIHGGLIREQTLVTKLLDRTPPLFTPSLAEDEGLDWFPPHTVSSGPRTPILPPHVT